MKRHFLAGFMAFCVGVMSLSTVSCTKEIEQDIADLKGQVAELAQKIADLEARLTSEVNTLNTAIANVDAKIAVVNVENKDGNIVLTLSNGDKVTVAAPDANANNTNLVTTVTENGKTYWAVVGADGKAKSLGVEVGHPDVKLSFKVNPETKELLISYDGKEYEGTGVLVKNPDDYAHVVTAFEDGEDYVKLTIGEAVYTLPKFVEDNASLVLGRTDFFLRYEGVKEVELTAEGIAEYYVMNEPDGWKATIDGTVLTVTAPTKKAIEIGAAEAEGLILVHATTNEGKCKVAKLEVKAGKGLTITIDGGDITMTNSFASMAYDYWGEPAGYNFTNFHIGIVESDQFVNDIEGYFKNTNDWGELLTGYQAMMYNNYDIEQKSYEEGVYETDVINITIEALYEWMAWDDADGLDYGKEFAIWIAPANANGTVDVAGVEYVTYTHLLNEVEITNITHNDATLNIEVNGATKFFVGYTDTFFEEWGSTLKDYMAEGGTWGYIVNGYADYVGDLALESGDYTGDNAIKVSDIFGEKLNFNTKYYVWVFPYIEGTVYNNYETQFEPYVYSFTTNNLAAGGTAATLELEEAGYDSVSALVTPAEGTETVYYYFYDTNTFNGFETDDEIVADVTANCYNPLGAEGGIVTEESLEPATNIVLVTVSIDEDGKYAVASETFQTLSLPTEVNAEHTVEFGALTADYSTLTVALTPAAGTTAYWKYMSESALGNYESDADLLAYVLVYGNAINTTTNATERYLAAGDSRTLVVAVVGADGKYNLYKENKYTTKNYPYSQDITVSLDSMTYDDAARTCTAVFSVTGSDKLVAQCGYDGGKASFEGNVITYAANKGNSYSFKYADVVDGKATVTFTNVYGTYMVVYATAYTVVDGAVTALAAETQALSIADNMQ